MLYWLLKHIFRLATRIFFKTLEVHNAQLVPNGVPLLITSNHPSTIMDALVIATQIKQPAHFLVMGKIFNTPWKLWLFRQINMIPLYRQHDDESKVVRNKEVFKTCYELLAQKKAIVIFPEGTSKWERRLRDIKKGAAQLALGAEAAYDYQLGVHIIPVGLNYSEAGKFQSKLFINFDAAIKVNDLINTSSLSKGEAVNQLTDCISERLKKLTIVIESQYLDEFVSNLEQIYKDDLIRQTAIGSAPIKDFRLTQTLVEAAHYFYRHEPVRLEQLNQKMSLYLKRLKLLKINDDLISRNLPFQKLLQMTIGRLGFLLLLFPIYAMGLIINYLPYRIPGLLSRFFHVSLEYQSAFKMGMGIITFFVFYLIEIIIILAILKMKFAVFIYIIVAPLSGYFCLYYWQQIIQFRYSWLWQRMTYKRKSVIIRLVKRRNDILTELENAKQEFLAQRRIT